MVRGQPSAITRDGVTARVTVNAYWSCSPDALFAELASGPQGLTAGAAAERLRRDGPNTVKDEARRSAFSLLLRQFESPLVRWCRLSAQFGGLAKVGSVSDHAASLCSGVALSGASPG